MQETTMLFPITPTEFWNKIRIIIEEVLTEKLSQQTNKLPQKALLKTADVCEIFQVSRPTINEWIKQNKLKSFKIKSRRYFWPADIEDAIHNLRRG